MQVYRQVLAVYRHQDVVANKHVDDSRSGKAAPESARCDVSDVSHRIAFRLLRCWLLPGMVSHSPPTIIPDRLHFDVK